MNEEGKIIVPTKLANSFPSVMDAILIIEAWRGPKYFATGNLINSLNT